MTTTLQTPSQYGTVGKSVRLYEGFLQKRRVIERRLQEAGLNEGDLRAWRDPERAVFRPGEMVESLREAGVSERPAGEDRPSELEELLQESASTSDFGSYLSDKATKRLMAGYTEAPSSWRQYTRIYSVPDFKPISFVRLNEMQDLLPVPEGGPYIDSPLDETVGPQVSVGTFGRTFGISRKAIVNDDLNQLRERPAALGRATVRTMAKSTIGLLEANPNTYDGNATFSVAHGNLITGVMSEQSVADLIKAMRRQKDDSGNKLALRPQALLAPPELEMEAMRIVNSTIVPLAGYAPGSTRTEALNFGVGGTNVLAAVVRNTIIEDYFNEPADFYVVADPNEAPTLAKGFLNGKQTPDIFLKDPGMRNVLGTSDPYSMNYDEVEWKVRHDWGDAILDWRGIAKSAN